MVGITGKKNLVFCELFGLLAALIVAVEPLSDNVVETKPT